MNDTEARTFPRSSIARPVAVRRPEKETLPKLFYKGAHQATLDPLAARRPDGGLFMWSEQQQSSSQVVSGNPNLQQQLGSRACYRTTSRMHIPWDWRVSLYTWTKGIASGVYLVAAVARACSAFCIANDSRCGCGSRRLFPASSLAITGWLVDLGPRTSGALLPDLHPAAVAQLAGQGRVHHRRHTRWCWRCTFFASWLGSKSLQNWLMIAGIPLSVLTAVYTAYLFAQAKARDLWQNPLLPPHLLVQALLWDRGVLLLLVSLTEGVIHHRRQAILGWQQLRP